MKKKKNKIRVYQDSKEIPFCIYKRIVQTGDFLYMVKGYEKGDDVRVSKKKLQNLFYEIEEDYASSINIKNEAIVLTGQMYIAVNERNKLINILSLIALTIKTISIRSFHELPDSEILNKESIKLFLQDVKVQKSSDLTKQSGYVKNKIEKYTNQIQLLETQLKKIEEDQEKSQYDIEEQFVNVCLGLEIPVDDKNITLYQYGLMVKALVSRVEEMNKIKSNAR